MGAFSPTLPFNERNWSPVSHSVTHTHSSAEQNQPYLSQSRQLPSSFYLFPKRHRTTADTFPFFFLFPLKSLYDLAKVIFCCRFAAHWKSPKNKKVYINFCHWRYWWEKTFRWRHQRLPAKVFMRCACVLVCVSARCCLITHYCYCSMFSRFRHT